MAITNFQLLDPGQKVTICRRTIGTGAPAVTDEFVTDYKKFGVGSTYYDKTNRILYIKNTITGAPSAPAPVVADLDKVSFTQNS